LHVHHIDCDPYHNTSDNLVTWCILCHMTYHRVKEAKERASKRKTSPNDAPRTWTKP
jgi:hypothetical protein